MGGSVIAYAHVQVEGSMGRKQRGSALLSGVAANPPLLLPSTKTNCLPTPTLPALVELPETAQDHRSLSRLLEELRAAAGGDTLPTTPGSTLATPLHVVLQV